MFTYAGCLLYLECPLAIPVYLLIIIGEPVLVHNHKAASTYIYLSFMLASVADLVMDKLS